MAWSWPLCDIVCSQKLRNSILRVSKNRQSRITVDHELSLRYLATSYSVLDLKRKYKLCKQCYRFFSLLGVYHCWKVGYKVKASIIQYVEDNKSINYNLQLSYKYSKYTNYWWYVVLGKFDLDREKKTFSASKFSTIY